MSLIIKPLGAHLAKGKDMIFFRKDPFIVCQVGNEIYQTMPHEAGGESPVWY